MAAGVIYVLVNPVHKNLLKIGKTARTAEERATEISRGTGVASPFWVAYDDYVNDCDKAEKLIHLRLSNYRHRSNREFFAIPLKEALPVVMSVVSEINAEFETTEESDAKLQYGEVEPVTNVVDEVRTESETAKRTDIELQSDELSPVVSILGEAYVKPETAEVTSVNPQISEVASLTEGVEFRPETTYSPGMLTPTLRVEIEKRGWLSNILLNEQGLKITDQSIRWRTKWQT